VCGITPYDATHIGHAATYLAYDTLIRVWLDAGYDVRYVQNTTDVDDPLLERATATGVDWRTYKERPRLCDLGYLRRAYRRADGRLDYRCPSEPVNDYVRKGGRAEDTVGRKCLCNALVTNIGMGQRQANGYEELPDADGRRRHRLREGVHHARSSVLSGPRRRRVAAAVRLNRGDRRPESALPVDGATDEKPRQRDHHDHGQDADDRPRTPRKVIRIARRLLV
jgi:tRNA synthetases class I (C) catalytic domain